MLTKREMRALSDSELFELSLKKNIKGCHTREANMAMEIRNERSGYWFDVPRKLTKEEYGYDE